MSYSCECTKTSARVLYWADSRRNLANLPDIRKVLSVNSPQSNSNVSFFPFLDEKKYLLTIQMVAADKHLFWKVWVFIYRISASVALEKFTNDT